MLKQVLITGINGYISQYLLKYKPASISITGTYHTKILANKPEIIQIPLNLAKNVPGQLEKVKADVVIHTAAVSNLTTCENNPDLAHRVNGMATDELAQWCNKINARLIYLSTDIVFDGAHAPYAEKDTPRPINIYGKSKYQGERAVAKYTANTIVRLALVLGQGIAKNKNFVDWIIERIKKEQQVPLFYDEIRTPVCAIDAAKMIWKIVLDKMQGTFHICSKENIDRFTLGKKICRHYKKNFNNVKKASLKDLTVKRPVDVSMLSNNADFLIPAVTLDIGRLFLNYE